ncbi:MAG: hypothetical protein IT377_27380 [Polyangiaceae bacterium]|nr:hypothetical protein [Polyangiaceae bacterium]
MVRRVSGVVVAVCLLPACQSEDSATGSGGAAGAAGSGGAAGDAGSVCFQPMQSLSVTVEPSPSDGGGFPDDWKTTGQITSSSKNELTIDDCPPGGSCTPNPRKVTIKAPLLDFTAPVGAYVSVHWTNQLYNAGAVKTTLGIRNVSTWNNQANPVETSEVTYLLVADGVLEHPDAAFKGNATAVDCPPPGQGAGKLYELSFGEAGKPAVPVPFGKVSTLMLAGEGWSASVVRSFEPYVYDADSPFAWWFMGVD